MIQKVSFYRSLHSKASGLLRTTSINSEDFSVDGIGIREQMKPILVNRSGGTDGFLLIYFHDEVSIQDKNGFQKKPPGHFVLWNPFDKHIYGNELDVWIHSWIHLSGKNVLKLVKATDIPTNEVSPLLYPDYFDAILQDIYNEFEGVFAPNKTIVKNLTENLLLKTARRFHERTRKEAVPEKMMKVKRFIDQHYDESFTLHELADMHQISASHLSNQFSFYFGIAPIEYRTKQRMQFAVFQLQNHNLRVSEIAESVGYSDVYYFSKHFKQYFGMSPSKAR